MTEDNKKCSFCGEPYIKDDNNKNIIVQSPSGNVFICQNCIEKAQKLIRQREKLNKKCMLSKKYSTPSKIKAYLDEYVIGQEEAKKILSIGVYNHMKFLDYYKNNDNPEVDLEKENILLLGSSGSGKTYLVKTLAKLLDVPYAICDSTALTASGYVGADVESVLQKLLSNANNDIERAEKGIVFIDEIDKKANRYKESDNITRDVSGMDVQQAFLKLIEGADVDVPISGRRINPEGGTVKINTSKILFIFAGAFVGIDKIIKKRLEYKNVSSIGVTLNNSKEVLSKDVEYNDVITKVTVEDLEKFGLIPEFLGRIPILCPLKELTEDEMCKILTEPKNALIKQYQEILKPDNVRLEFSSDAIREVAKKAIKNKTGARGLRAVMSNLLLETMYSLPDNKEEGKRILTINKECVLSNEKPEIKSERKADVF